MIENRGRSVQNVIFDLYGTLVDIHTNEWKDSVWQYMIRLLDMSGAHYEKPEDLRDAYHNCVREAKRQASMAAGPGTIPEIDVGQVFRSLYTGKGVEPVQRYNLIPEESVMVGNDDSADCCGAAAVGMRSVYINAE